MSDILSHSILNELEFSALDIETTGLSPTSDAIVEIAVIRFTRNSTLAYFQELVNPSRPIPTKATQIHGISNEIVKNALTIDMVLPSLLSFIQNSILVVQNSIFDLSFLIHQAKLLQLDFPNLPVFCTLQMTRKYYPFLPKYKLAFLKEHFKIETFKIRTGKKQLYHEALNDAFVAMEVFRACLNENGFWSKKFSEVAFHEKGLIRTKDYNNYLF